METTLQSPKAVPLHRIGGAAFMFGNLLFLVNKFNEMSLHFLGRPMPDVIDGQNILLIAIGQAALIIGYVAWFKHFAPRVPRPAKNALRLFALGGVVLAIGHISFMNGLAKYLPPAVFRYADNMFFLVFIGLLLLLIGLIWFGILTLRQPMLNRWQWLPLFTGLMGFIGFFIFSGEDITATFLVFRTLFALGLIGLGLVLWLEKGTNE